MPGRPRPLCCASRSPFAPPTRRAVSKRYAATFRRRLKASNGFWKIGCTSRRKVSASCLLRIPSAEAAVSIAIVPAVGSWRRRIILASVVLPLPDSPTMLRIVA